MKVKKNFTNTISQSRWEGNIYEKGSVKNYEVLYSGSHLLNILHI